MSRIDLNLLLVFDEILRQRSVTRAGDRLGLSQPAMSHALNRLRYQLKDQLFIRGIHGMEPTPRAERLAEPVRQALMTLRGAMEEEAFAPGETRQRFSIAVNNYAAIALTGPILLRARALAPHLELGFRPSGTLDVPAMLDRAELDFALLSDPPQLTRFPCERLIEDDFVGVVRSGHPILDRPFDVAAMTSLPHLHVSSSGDDLSGLDSQLESLGRTRHIEAEAPYLSAGAILPRSDMIAIMARHIGGEFRQAYSVDLVELPIQPAPLQCSLVWHNRLRDHPAHRWMREVIQSVAGELRHGQAASP